ncbi:MAG: hypothetical protein JNM72_27530 [Deltaproteobacteria bacterium]|nr:hypothetical protein [Deltaproteobacteria bacterium]
MFHSMRNTPQSGTTVQDAIAGVRRRLPPGWSADALLGPRGPSLRLSGPDARMAELDVVFRRAIAPRDAQALLAPGPGPTLFIAPHLGARARQLIAAGGASYADTTGNLRVVVSEPAIFLEGVGAERDPDRAPRPLNSLRGAAAGRVVRALAELELPLGIRALSAASATPLSSVSRVVSFLEAEALITRDTQKQVSDVDRPALLQRWAADYTLTRSNALLQFLEPRGIPSLWAKLGRLPRYAATGSTAGPGIAATRIAMIYVDQPHDAARTLGLVPAEAGANVWLLSPFDDVVFARTRLRAVGQGASAVDVTIVSAAQAYVDLASAPGRGPQEAEAMLAHMTEGRNDR